MIRDAISAVIEGKDLDTPQAKAVMSEMMSGTATPSQIASFITACRMKGETEDELVGFALAMREGSAKISAPSNAVDLCGTGGDCSGTFNISTVASFIVSSCGVPVAKHGNRSVSSRSGSADLLEALAIPYDLDTLSVQASIASTGFGFMFAPNFHPSMRNVIGPRRELGVRTMFNVLGPLTNPAQVQAQLLGVYDPAVAPKLTKVLSRLGVKRAMVVNGNGTDEVSNLGPTRVSELKNGKVKKYTIEPSDLGMDLAEPKDLMATSPLDSARTTMSILRGTRSPKYDVAVMNAGAALYVAGAVKNLDDGVSTASKAVQSGAALRKLEEVASFARAREAERQRAMDIASLRTRRIVPSVLKERSSELTSAIAERIVSMPDGQERLDALEPELIMAPNVLSVISLSRLDNVITKGVPKISAKRRSGTSFSESISRPGLAVIGEYKPRSPSTVGTYLPPDPEMAASTYESTGFAAMSVLVEDAFFGGSPDLFALVRERTSLPLLFKDFIVSEEQLDLASSLGADSVLLIAKALRKDTMERFVDLAVGKGIEPLVELHDLDDIEKMVSCRNSGKVHVVGLNSRDLRTMGTDMSGLNALRAHLPHDKLVVAESGVKEANDMLSLKGFDAVLVGTSLMSSLDLPAKAEEFVKAGRSVTE